MKTKLTFVLCGDTPIGEGKRRIRASLTDEGISAIEQKGSQRLIPFLQSINPQESSAILCNLDAEMERASNDIAITGRPNVDQCEELANGLFDALTPLVGRSIYWFSLRHSIPGSRHYLLFSRIRSAAMTKGLTTSSIYI